MIKERKPESERSGDPSAFPYHQSKTGKLCQSRWNVWSTAGHKGVKNMVAVGMPLSISDLCLDSLSIPLSHKSPRKPQNKRL